MLSLDVKLTDSGYKIFTKGGRNQTEIDAVEWAKFAQDSGAGEIVVNSIDTDGVKRGFDLPLLNLICEAVNIPVVASGGAGSINDFVTLFKNTKVDAGLGASVFHFNEFSIKELKNELRNNKIEVRM